MTLSNLYFVSTNLTNTPLLELQRVEVENGQRTYPIYKRNTPNFYHLIVSTKEKPRSLQQTLTRVFLG